MSHFVAIINGKAPSGGIGGVSDADLSNIAVNYLTEGVVLPTNYLIEQQDTPDMTVKINTGKAYIDKSDHTIKYLTHLDTVASGVITANSSGNPRIDAVIIKINLGATPDNYASNVATIVVVPGTPAGSPVAPTDGEIQTAVGAGNPYYRLANVAVANGATSIITANISSTRTLTHLNQTIIRQDDTANSYVNKTVILTGWGQIVGNNTVNLFEAVTFGLTFASAPVVVGVVLGGVQTTPATTIGSFSTSKAGVMSFMPIAITTAGFTARLGLVNAAAEAFPAGYYWGYSWIAIGQLV